MPAFHIKIIPMNKREIFDKICEVTSEVCYVGTVDIINGCKERDCVMARSVVVFWCNAAGFSASEIAKLANVRNVTQVNNIIAKIEEYWSDIYLYRMIVKEVGKILSNFAKTINSDFDFNKPISHIQKITGIQ